MKGKLIKYKDCDYTLMVGNYMYAFTNVPKGLDYRANKLSIKNCQSIENGYDLDELAEEYAKSKHQAPHVWLSYIDHYTQGFQKALELLGDKKFSEDDMISAYFEGTNDGAQFESMMDYDHSDNSEVESFSEQTEQDFRKSLQQTEWEVEVEMICPHPSDTYVCGMQYGCDEDGCNHPNQIPYLDKDGCLNLKRI
jgi:hypothetical protein